MRISYSQPYFIAWPEFFLRASLSDRFVIMDSVQFPRGFTWITRNRIKGKDGQLWLTVPIHRKGRGLQRINDIEIYYGEDWVKKHLRTFEHTYKNSPYFGDIFPELQKIYLKREKYLLDFLIPLIELIFSLFHINGNWILLSALGIKSKKEKLIFDVAEKLGADEIILQGEAKAHLDIDKLKNTGLRIEIVKYRFPVYPQLWGDFVKNLSSLDVLFNCLPKAWEISSKGQEVLPG